jgi:hypothetical protein
MTAIAVPMNNNYSGFLAGLLAILAVLVMLMNLVTPVPVPNPPNISIDVAIVEDDVGWQNIWTEIVDEIVSKATGGKVRVFPRCELLLAEMSAGARFRLYIMDNDLGKGYLTGPMCIPQIRSFQPDAVIIGNSGNNDDPGFVKAGAKAFFSKARIDLGEITKLVTALLQ